MLPLANDSDRDWERFGRTDPYFAVLTSPRYHGQLSAADRETFFGSGEAHVEKVFAIIRSRLDPAFAPATALDFGCGVGRVLIPLAKRCREVTGVDVSMAMLSEARRNCDAAGAKRVRLIPTRSLASLRERFDFVHSYIVLQHIPVRRGESLVRALASRLAPDGIGVFHVTYARPPKPPMSRVLSWARTNVPGAQWAANLVLGRAPTSPLMQMNRYSVTRLLDILWQEGCGEVHVRFSDHQGYRGVLLFARKANVDAFL